DVDFRIRQAGDRRFEVEINVEDLRVCNPRRLDEARTEAATPLETVERDRVPDGCLDAALDLLARKGEDVDAFTALERRERGRRVDELRRLVRLPEGMIPELGV